MFFKKSLKENEQEKTEHADEKFYAEIQKELESRGYDHVIILAGNKKVGEMQAYANGKTGVLGRMVGAFLDEQSDIMRAMMVDKMKSLGSLLDKVCENEDCPVHGKNSEE